MRNLSRSREGFTLTELSVLMGVGVILASVVAADLNQARTKLLQQACAANMKHWGMAFSMYADDYNGTIYYDVGGLHFTELGSPLQQYLGTPCDPITTLLTMRMCPARIGQVTFGTVSYQMPIGQYHKGLGYTHADQSGSPYFRGGNYWPDLKSVPQPAQYLLMFECYNTLHCVELLTAMSNPAISSGNVDPLPPIARHGGGALNCLFGDFHVEFVSATTITNHEVGCNSTGNTWFDLN